MRPLNPTHPARKGLSTSRPSRASSDVRRRRSRSGAETIYARLSAAYDRYTQDVPEDAFPTFLESLLLEDLGRR